MEDYRKRLGGLADKLKQDKPATPIQQVAPVKAEVPATVKEVQFNNWIPKTLLKQLKAYGLEHDLSLKLLNIQALELFLKTKNKAALDS